MKGKDKFLILAGIGAVAGYRAICGIGVFNRIRFKKQFEAISAYAKTNYPGAEIGDIVPFNDGWTCNLSVNGANIIIYIIPSDNGGFIFSQTQM